MTLSAGTKLGSHEILSLLGSGGMGEVYRARDSKLKRDVAIKVLRDATVPDPDRLARFHREAELLATLNHPNVGHDGARSFSPDGRWLAYFSDESGRGEVYVRAYPGPGPKVQISTQGGGEPVWARNGRELFYRSGDAVLEMDVTLQPSFIAGKPRELFHGPYRTMLSPAQYDVGPDGQRFLMILPDPREFAPTQVTVVVKGF